MGRSRNRGGGGGGKEPAGQGAPQTPQQLVKSADELKNRAQRRGGADSFRLYEEAAVKLQEAIQTLLAAGAAGDALFDLGQTFESYAAEVIRVVRLAPLGPGAMEQEGQAEAMAGDLYRRACEAYGQVPSYESHVNRGNVLANWADLVADPVAAVQTRAEALNAYEAALAAAAAGAQQGGGEGEGEAEEPDVELLTNLGDCLVAQAEALCEGGSGADGGALYNRAMGAYQEACSHLDSARGEDLPGLLYNWGVGLHSMGTHATGDPAAAVALLGDAAGKLRHAASFARGDPAPLNALGDVLVAMAEAETAKEGGGDAAAAEALWRKALDEGYTAALRIDRRDQNAQVGRAEVHVAAGRRLAAAGDAAGAAAEWGRSAQAYRAAVRDCRADGKGSVKEQAEVAYNLLCAVCLGGGSEDEAKSLAEGLLACGGASPDELARDDDLAALRARPWFAPLVGASGGGGSLKLGSTS